VRLLVPANSEALIVAGFQALMFAIGTIQQGASTLTA
jgi:hypothetical protein